MGTAPATSGIEITATFFPLAFLLLFFPPTFVIDGQPTAGKWRTPVTIPVSAGSHHVKVFFKYLGMFDVGSAQTTVDVSDGSARRVSYKAPWLVFLSGKLAVG
jgi:hypothetical protein